VRTTAWGASVPKVHRIPGDASPQAAATQPDRSAPAADRSGHSYAEVAAAARVPPGHSRPEPGADQAPPPRSGRAERKPVYLVDGPFRDSDLERQFDLIWSAQTPRVHRPTAALQEEPDCFQLFVDLPGVRPDDVVIMAASYTIMVTGTRHPPAPGVVWQPAPPTGEFRVDLRLPRPILPQRVAGRLSGGVLHVWLPKITGGPAERRRDPGADR
jgi:HSP20 family molecular chaperone IbpA